MAHNISSKNLNWNKQFSSLKLTGGVDCNLKISRYPDLYVSGGGKIKKNLRLGGSLTVLNNIDISGDLTIGGALVANTLAVVELTAEKFIGDLQGNICSDTTVFGDITVTGDIFGNINSDNGNNSVQTFTNKSIDADTNFITNIDNNEIKVNAGIDASKIHDGNVTNTEYGYLSDVTSNIQMQIDDKIDANIAVNNFVVVGYGGIGLNANIALNDINTTWQTCDFDVNLITSPIRTTQDIANNGIRVNKKGVWQITVKISLIFDEANNGRTMQLRVFNVDTMTGSPTIFNFFVGRNQTGVNLNFTINVEIAPPVTTDLLAIQVHSLDNTYTTVYQIGSIFQVNNISEAQFIDGAITPSA